MNNLEHDPIYIYSGDLTNGSIELKHSIKMKYMKIEKFRCVNTAYNVINKILKVYEVKAGIPTTLTLNLTDGYYNATQFLQHIQTLLNTSVNYTYNVSLLPIVEKVFITNNDIVSNTFQIDFGAIDSPQDIRRFLGFDSNYTAGSNTLTSAKIPNMLKDMFYYLKSNLGEYANHKPYHTSNTGNIEHDILLMLDISDSPHGSVVKYDDQNELFFKMESDDRFFKKLTFKIVDKNDVEIDFRGSDFYLELTYYF